MKIVEFFKKYNGIGVDFDGYYGFQCVDLYRKYCEEVLKIPQSRGVTGAYQIWETYLKEHFTQIKNTPDGVPILGDVIIWNKNAGLGYGHVAVFNYGDKNEFVSFDQNFPTGSVCHFQNHNYTNIFGWLRPKNTDFTEIKITDQTKIDIGEPWGIMEVQAIRSTLNDQEKTIEALKDQNEDAVLVHKQALSDLDTVWQNKLTTAKDALKLCQQKKIENEELFILLNMAFNKAFDGIKDKIRGWIR